MISDEANESTADYATLENVVFAPPTNHSDQQEDSTNAAGSDDKTSSANQTQLLLLLNKSYQEAIQEKIDNLKILLKLNAQQQNEICEQMSFNASANPTSSTSGSTSTAPSKLKYKTLDVHGSNVNEIELNKIKDNYFMDRFNSCPEDNFDTIRKNKMHFYDYLPQIKPGWSLENRIKLRKAVFNDTIRIIKNPLVNKISYLEEKLLNATLLASRRKEPDIINLQKMLRDYKTQLNRIDNLNESQILAELDETKIDWMKISKIDFKCIWSSNECRLLWMNVCNPAINVEKWTAGENQDLIELARKHGERNWKQIAIELNTKRSAYLCMKRYHEKTAEKYCKRDWTDEETKELCEKAELHRSGISIPFNYLCYLNGRRDRNSVYIWYLKVNPQLNHGKWLPSEIQAFDEAVEYYKYNLNWQEISEYVGTRTTLQCKERYELKFQYPEKYINWTIEEDKLLLDAIDKIGTHWVKIASTYFPKRTDHSCLFRYTKLMQWRKQTEWFDSLPDEVKEFLTFIFRRVGKSYSKKKRRFEKLDDQNEEAKMLFTEKGELVPSSPLFGTGIRNLAHVIETINEKEDLVFEFIEQKRNGQLSLSLLNRIGIFTPVVNSLISKCKIYHGEKPIRKQREKKRVEKRQEKDVNQVKEKKVKVPRLKIKKPTVKEILPNESAIDSAAPSTSTSTSAQDTQITTQKTKRKMLSTSKTKPPKRLKTEINTETSQNESVSENTLLKKRGRKKSIINLIKSNESQSANEVDHIDDKINKRKNLISGLLKLENGKELNVSTSFDANFANNQIESISSNLIQSNINQEETTNRSKASKINKRALTVSNLLNSNSNSFTAETANSEIEPKHRPKTATKKPKVSKEKNKNNSKIKPSQNETTLTISPISNLNVTQSVFVTSLTQHENASLLINFDSIENGTKIPCFGEQYNEFKYMYSLKKDNNPKYFQRFAIIKCKEKGLVAIKPLNGGSLKKEWLTEDKLSQIETALSKINI